jgi:membrane protein DedA with SNARE-associated domain
LSKIWNLIFCGILSIVVSTIIVVVSIQAVAKFEMAMLPKLILPIIIVVIPAYILIYSGLFKKKRKANKNG